MSENDLVLPHCVVMVDREGDPHQPATRRRGRGHYAFDRFFCLFEFSNMLFENMLNMLNMLKTRLTFCAYILLILDT